MSRGAYFFQNRRQSRPAIAPPLRDAAYRNAVPWRFGRRFPVRRAPLNEWSSGDQWSSGTVDSSFARAFPFPSTQPSACACCYGSVIRRQPQVRVHVHQHISVHVQQHPCPSGLVVVVAAVDRCRQPLCSAGAVRRFAPPMMLMVGRTNQPPTMHQPAPPRAAFSAFCSASISVSAPPHSRSSVLILAPHTSRPADCIVVVAAAAAAAAGSSPETESVRRVL
ncbi:hypothetical protein MSAN_01605500 [Mycena sanguinolenta]|uniref:Uncharacterized protein n=1 Tax=Mycena sanguinolenta TaxID=230812 RepID=A0A8H6Y0E7_9AGAR|nr:hypothetical protein MSAN_01605500 [Mycena sanguinolenta]